MTNAQSFAEKQMRKTRRLTSRLIPPVQSTYREKRFFEIDLLRGVTITLVVVYHLVFDINYFQIFQIELYNGFWLYFQRTAAFLFVFIFGICTAISAKRHSNSLLALHFAKRAAKLGAVALLITLATWIYPREGFIVFGVIHFLAIATLLSLLFLRFEKLNFAIGSLLVLLGLLLNSLTTQNPVLLVLGVPFSGFYSLDYFPLLPWFGVVLIGMTLGRYVYVQNKIRIEIPQNKFTEKVSFLGRNTLVIYLLHQPILIALIQMATFLF